MTSILAVRDLILAQLQTQRPWWTVYDGEPDAKVPTDASGKALPYVCLYMAPSWREEVGESLAADPGVERVTWQVTVASGYTSTTLRAVEKADAILTGWILGGRTGPVRRDPTVPLRIDRDVTPARWFAPLRYRADLS